MSLSQQHAARVFAHLLRIAGDSITYLPVDGQDIPLDALVTGPGQQAPSADGAMRTDAVDLVVRVSASAVDAALAAQGLAIRPPAHGDLVTARGLAYAVMSAAKTAGGEYRIELRAQRMTGLGRAFGG